MPSLFKYFDFILYISSFFWFFFLKRLNFAQIHKYPQFIYTRFIRVHGDIRLKYRLFSIVSDDLLKRGISTFLCLISNLFVTCERVNCKGCAAALLDGVLRQVFARGSYGICECGQDGIVIYGDFLFWVTRGCAKISIS